MDRSILHVDLNNCYASIEMLYDPTLRGIPLVVGGDEELRHGIVLAKSYEAKAYGFAVAQFDNISTGNCAGGCPQAVVVCAGIRKLNLKLKLLCQDFRISCSSHIFAEYQGAGCAGQFCINCICRNFNVAECGFPQVRRRFQRI